MALFDWIASLGTAGAVRNTTKVLAERRVAEHRVDALLARLTTEPTSDPSRAA